MKKALIILLFAAAALSFGGKVLADYFASGTLVSNNLLFGANSQGIYFFNYDASLIPSGTSLKVQFSQNNSDWYNSLGVLGEWDYLSQGYSSINLSALEWSGPSFYYKAEFISDGSNTPVLDEVSITYSNISSCNLNRTGDYSVDFWCVLDGYHHIQGNLNIVGSGVVQISAASSLVFNSSKSITLSDNAQILVSETGTEIKKQ